MIKKSMLFFIIAHLFCCVDKVEAGVGDETSSLVKYNSGNYFSLINEKTITIDEQLSSNLLYLFAFSRTSKAIELKIAISLEDNFIGGLSQMFTHLEKVIFKAGLGITDEQITLFAQQQKKYFNEIEFEHLSDLDVSHQKITDIGAKTIAENLKGLISLNLKDNYIGYEGILALINDLPNLKYFSFDMENIESVENQDMLRNLMAQKGISEYFNHDYVG